MCSCRREGARRRHMSRCTLCKIATYCSRDCQAAHWPAHRPFCKRLAADRDGVPERWPLAARPPSAERTSGAPTAWTFERGQGRFKLPRPQFEDALDFRALLDFRAGEVVVTLVDSCVPRRSARRHALRDLGVESLHDAFSAAQGGGGWTFELPILCAGCTHTAPRVLRFALRLHESTVVRGEYRLRGTVERGRGCARCGGGAVAPVACRFEPLKREGPTWDTAYRADTHAEGAPGFTRKVWHDSEGRPRRAHVDCVAVLIALAWEVGIVVRESRAVPWNPAPPFDAPELRSGDRLDMTHGPSCTELLVFAGRVYAGGGAPRGRYVKTAFVSRAGGPLQQRACGTLEEYKELLREAAASPVVAVGATAAQR